MKLRKTKKGNSLRKVLSFGVMSLVHKLRKHFDYLNMISDVIEMKGRKINL